MKQGVDRHAPELEGAYLEMNLTRRCVLGGGVAALGTLLVGEVQAAGNIAVIVHPSNKETPSLADLAAIFSTRRQSWGSGQRIVPFNFQAKDGVRVAFDRTVLNMNADEVARYWIDRRIRGGSPPPKQVGNALMIVRLVAKLEGAIAYVPQSIVDSSVRVIRSV